MSINKGFVIAITMAIFVCLFTTLDIVAANDEGLFEREFNLSETTLTPDILIDKDINYWQEIELIDKELDTGIFSTNGDCTDETIQITDVHLDGSQSNPQNVIGGILLVLPCNAIIFCHVCAILPDGTYITNRIMEKPLIQAVKCILNIDTIKAKSIFTRSWDIFSFHILTP